MVPVKARNIDFYVWLSLFVVLVPCVLYIQFSNLSSPLIEPHPWRQTQTALTTLSLFKKQTELFFYASPFNGRLWDFVYEFPLYQWSCVQVMSLGVGLEVASRLVSLFSFFLGGIFFYRILQILFSDMVAKWSLLFYLISPFNIVFSRTALIDIQVQSLMILTWFCGLKWWRTQKMFFLGLFTLLGGLAAATKVTIWFTPWLVLSSFCCYQFFRKTASKRTVILLICALMVQLLFYWIWNEWTEWKRGDATFDINREWIMGSLDQRLEAWRWIKIGGWVFRSVLSDWLIIPAGIGAWVLSRKTKWGVVGVFVILLIPILLFFNVYTFHDYYLIAQTPYLFLLAGLGINALGDFSKSVRIGIILITMVLLLNHLKGVKYYLEPIFDKQEGKLVLEETIKALTEDSEVVFVRVNQDPWKVPLYSGRLIATEYAESFVEEKSVAPSMFYFPKGKEKFSLLNDFDRVGVVQKNDLVFFRVRDQPPFLIDAADQIILSKNPIDELGIRMPLIDDRGGVIVNSCNNTAKRITYELAVSGDVSSLNLQNAEGKVITVPYRKYLSLPSKSGMCWLRIVR